MTRTPTEVPTKEGTGDGKPVLCSLPGVPDSEDGGGVGLSGKGGLFELRTGEVAWSSDAQEKKGSPRNGLLLTTESSGAGGWREWERKSGNAGLLCDVGTVQEVGTGQRRPGSRAGLARERVAGGPPTKCFSKLTWQVPLF